jgi:RNA polymerase sigma-70 factor (ECF subfamily)
MVAGVDPLSRLARQAQDGDGRALDAFVRATYDQVLRLCAAVVDAQSADDLSQETFTQAVRALPRFRGESSARTWLLAIAHHVCLDELRRRSARRGRHVPVPVDAGRWPAAGDGGDEVAVADLIGRLGPDRRAAFVLTQVLGLSYAEAARVCECPLGTVRSRVARARADLIELLGAAQDEGRRSSSA